MSRISGCLLATAIAFASTAVAVPEAAAAEGYANCNNFIDSVPATITTQGVWCLRKDLSTNITSGDAITIKTNNVTIDCNDFKLGGLAAGDQSTTYGIATDAGIKNATVRNCNVRGFLTGITLRPGGSGHLVEDNLVDGSLEIGILAEGSNNSIRRNRVFDTGGPISRLSGSTPVSYLYGIVAYGDVIDNTVTNIFSTSSAAIKSTTGVRVRGSGYDIRRNRIRGLMATGATGQARGIDAVGGEHHRVDDNYILAESDSAVNGFGILGHSTGNTFCVNNTVSGFAFGMRQCLDVGGNHLP